MAVFPELFELFRVEDLGEGSWRRERWADQRVVGKHFGVFAGGVEGGFDDEQNGSNGVAGSSAALAPSVPRWVG